MLQRTQLWIIHQTIPLPVQVKPEEARARFKNGLLEITLPKVEAPKGRILDIETD